MMACLHTGKLALLVILVSGGVVLQFLIRPLFSESENSWVNATKFLTGASTVGSIAIPVILKHAGVISWGALAMEFSSYFVLLLAILCYIYIQTNDEDGYGMI